MSTYPHVHGVETGLAYRLKAIGARVVSVDMTGSEDRGDLVGHVPVYTVVLGRDDDRTLTLPISTGQAPYEPTPFDVMDTLLCNASLLVHEGMGGDEARGEMIATRIFVEGPDCWEDWMYHADRDPERQGDYDDAHPVMGDEDDEPEDDEPDPEAMGRLARRALGIKESSGE